MKIAVCLMGQIRGISKSLIDRLSEENIDFDCYGHTWLPNKYIYENCGCGVNASVPVNGNTFIEAMDTFNFKKFLIEKEYDIPLGDNFIEGASAGVNFKNPGPAWKSIQNSYNLIQNPEEYDFIIKSRYETMFDHPLCINKLDQNKLNVHKICHENTTVCHDHYWICNPSIANQVFNAIDLFHLFGPQYNGEAILSNVIDHYGIQISTMPWCPIDLIGRNMAQ